MFRQQGHDQHPLETEQDNHKEQHGFGHVEGGWRFVDVKGGVLVTKTEGMGRKLIETEQSNCMHVYQLALEIYFEKKLLTFLI